jgi:serine/threonine-protein kinase
VVRRPTDPRLRVLQGHALHRTEGGVGAAVEAYAAALDLDPGALDAEAWADLAGNLARERALAERSAKVLVRGGPAAAPAVLALTQEGPPAVRLRALELARELGAEDGIDRDAAWRALLDDQDCDVRRAASKRLGELGSRAALPRLHELAKQTRPIRGLLGGARSAPACGAAEAEAAVRRIEAASPAASR